MDVILFCDPLPDPRCVAAYRGGPGRPVFGEGGRDCGAPCDRVAYSEPGVGYVMLDGHCEARRRPSRHLSRLAIGRITPAYPSAYEFVHVYLIDLFLFTGNLPERVVVPDADTF
jgi:hypothetical protein